MKLIKDINFLIVGLGLLGGSYAKGLKNIGFNVSAITKNQDDIEFAIENKIIELTHYFISLIAPGRHSICITVL